jgi:glycosyltransferase involved in cell wall biosynthesis
MRFVIDARLNAYRRGGIPTYTRALLGALAAAAPADQFMVLQHRDHLRPLAIAPNVTRRTAYTPPHHRLEPLTLTAELLATRPSVVHFPDFIAPRVRPFPAVVTIHDLAFLRFPEILTDDARAFYRQVGASAARAQGIIAVSQATRNDISELLNIAPERIDVVYEAAAPLFAPLDLLPAETRTIDNHLIEVDSFLLFVSTIEPRKNLPLLLQALRICLDRRPAAEYRLLVVGARGWRDDAVFQLVNQLNLGEHVTFLGAVSSQDLRWLYSACRVYVNPSRYEGFGLPLLEAMACGAACLAADTTSLPEVGGTAARYLPVDDAGAWADAIAELWDDEPARGELGRLGRARAQEFTWSRAARETLAVYRRAVQRKSA